MTHILIATTFFLIGLIVGGFIILNHLGILKEDREEPEEIPLSFSQGQKETIADVLKRVTGAQKVEFVEGNPPDFDKLFQGTRINKNLVNIDTYKKLVDSKLQEATTHEKWDDMTKLSEFYNSIDDWFNNRKKWFEERVNKKIKANILLCDCPSCQERFDQGIQINTIDDSVKWFLHECHHKIENEEFQYEDYK